jgi:TolA-binding protein
MKDFAEEPNEKKDSKEKNGASFLDGHEALLKNIQPAEQEKKEEEKPSFLDTLPSIPSAPKKSVPETSEEKPAPKKEVKDDQADFLSALPSLDSQPKKSDSAPSEEAKPEPKSKPAPQPKPAAKPKVVAKSDQPELPLVEEKPAPSKEKAAPKAPEKKEAKTATASKAPKKSGSGKKKGKSSSKKKKQKNRPKPAPQPVAVQKQEKKKPQEKPAHPVHHTERDKEEEARHKAILEEQRLKQQEVSEVLAWAKKYAKPALVAVLALSILSLGVAAIKNRRIKKAQKADILLMQAQRAQNDGALSAVLEDYSSTPAAPIALVELARIKFNAGDIDAAEALYQKFQKEYRNHDLASQVELNLIACKEARGELKEAEALYTAFSEKYSESYLAPAAMLARAHCLEADGQLQEAKMAYEDLMANYPESNWAKSAELNLTLLQAKMD